jgi:hypothetical protein
MLRYTYIACRVTVTTVLHARPDLINSESSVKSQFYFISRFSSTNYYFSRYLKYFNAHFYTKYLNQRGRLRVAATTEGLHSTQQFSLKAVLMISNV